MEIINVNNNQVLAGASHYPCVGFISGPLRVIGGVAQAAINAVGFVFALIPSAGGLISPDSKWHVKALFVDECKAICHIFRGVIEFIPGTSFFIDKFDAPKYEHLEGKDSKTRVALDGSWPCIYLLKKQSSI